MRTILSFFLILVSLFSFGQGLKPTGTLKLIPSPAIYKRTADSTLHMYQGPAFGWDRLITGRDTLGSGTGGDNYGYWKLASGGGDTTAFNINYGYLYNHWALGDTVVTSNSYMGFLYNWYAVDGGSGALYNPATAHIPSITEWAAFWDYLNTLDAGNEGNLLKESGYTYWESPNAGTNSTGFNARGAGYRYADGSFGNWGLAAVWWTSDQVDGSNANFANLNYDSSGLYSDSDNKIVGYSVRLIVDSPIEVSGDNGIYVGNDGKRYPCKRYPYLGDGIFWLTENLYETKYSDGSLIEEVTNPITWSGLSTGARCSYDNLNSNAFVASSTVRSIANDNAHVPTYAEYGYLLDYLTSVNPGNEAAILKESGLAHWIADNTGTDNYGFALRGGGMRGDGGGGDFNSIGEFGGLWSATSQDANFGYMIAFRNYQSTWESWPDEKTDGAGVRLIVNTPNTLSEDGTTGTYIGNDGTVYKVILIAESYWLAEPLLETKMSDGSLIPEVTDGPAWGALTTRARCSYNNTSSNAFIPEIGAGSDLLVHAKNKIDFKDTPSITWTKTQVNDSTIQIEAALADSLGGGGTGGGGISSSGSAHYIPRWNDTGDSLIVSPIYVMGIDTALISTAKNEDSYGDNLIIGQEDGSHRRDSTFTGSSNTLIGSRTAPYLSTGIGNTLVGNVAGYYLGKGSNNTAIGMQAGSLMEDDAHRNIMIGVMSGNYSVNDSDMIFIGDNSWSDAGERIHNSIAIGNGANVYLSNQIRLGNDSIKYTDLKGLVNIPELQVTSSGYGDGKILISNSSGILSYTDLPTGSGSVATVSVVSANGISGTVASPTLNPAITLSLGAITPTSINGIAFSSIGTNSLWLGGGGGSAGAGSSNTAIGHNAGLTSTTGMQNTFIGNAAGTNITTGSVNVAIGESALNGASSSSSWGNTCIGYHALASISSGASNCSIGYLALGGLTTGSGNVALGTNAGLGINGTFGTYNTNSFASVFIGEETTPLADEGSNEVVIGYGAIGHGTNTVTLGSAFNDSTFLSGTIYGIVYPYVSKSSAYTAKANDQVINCTGSGTFNITLPSAVGIPGKVYIIKKSGTSTTSVVTTSSQTIDGASSYALTAQWSKVTVMSDGANWIML